MQQENSTKATENQKGGKMITQTLFWYLGLRGLAIFAMSLHFAIYSTFLLSRGLNLFQINLVNVAFYTTLFVFEIPTGAFADIFGRKTSVVLAGVFSTLGTLMYYLAAGFWGFTAAEALLAVGSTFLSGAFTAWAIDRLKHFGHDADLKKLFVRENQVIQIVGILGGLFGSWIATRNLALTWLASSVLFLLWTGTAFFGLKEEYFVRKKFSFSAGLSALKETARSSISFGLKHKTVRFILLVGALQYLCIMPMNMQWQPWFSQFFHSVADNGWLWVSMSITILLGSSSMHWVLKMTRSEASALIFTQVLIGLTMAGTVASQIFPISLTIFLVNEFFRGLFKPIKDAYLNDQLPSKERATVISFEAIAHHVGGGIGLVLSGWVALSQGIAFSWVAFGLILAFGSLVVYKTSRV